MNLASLCELLCGLIDDELTEMGRVIATLSFVSTMSFLLCERKHKKIFQKLIEIYDSCLIIALNN